MVVRKVLDAIALNPYWGKATVALVRLSVISFPLLNNLRSYDTSL